MATGLNQSDTTAFIPSRGGGNEIAVDLMSRGRTPLFRHLIQTIRQAQWLNEKPQHGAFFFEAREASRVSRRDFMRMLGAAGVLTAADGCIPQVLPRPARVRNSDPVAIIGAGVAGLTTAYRLLQAGIPCEIFEASERTGGRMLTKYDFNKDGMFCELGGELVDSNHADLIALAKELGVGIQELKGRDKGVDLYFFGGKHYSDEQLIPLFQPFAEKLAADFEGIYDLEQNFTEKAAKFDRMSLAAYLDKTGRGVEKWIVDMLGVAYTIEYGRELDEQSSLNLIAYLQADTSKGFKLYGDSDESKRIKGGSSSLTSAIVKALGDKVKIHKDHRLVKIQQTGSSIRLNFETDGATRSVKFSRVVSAIPFTMLRLVEGVRALALSREKQTAIAQFGYGNNTKVMYGFTERWWRNPTINLPAVSNGSIFTDLPLQCTWETSRGQSGTGGILTNYLGGDAATRQIAVQNLASFHEELNRVFPGVREKFDGRRAIMNWPKYKYTHGSYSCPLVGQYTTMLKANAEPELNGRLIFAGEHTSVDFSGFMNGAVQSGNRAAREILEPKKLELQKAA